MSAVEPSYIYIERHTSTNHAGLPKKESTKNYTEGKLEICEEQIILL